MYMCMDTFIVVLFSWLSVFDPYVVYSLEEWKYVSHIQDGVTSSAYINSVTSETTPLCLLRCSYQAGCSMVGYSATRRICDLYGDLLTDDLTFTFQDSTEFYAHSSLFSGMTCTAFDLADATRTPFLTEYSYGDLVQYSCNDGYERTFGDFERSCIGMDEWSGSDLVCTGITCVAVDVTDSAKYPDKELYGYNEVVIYTCDPGFELTTGSQARSCTAIDVWSGTTITCTAITCGPPGYISDSSMSPDKSLYTYNEDVTYTCDPGFENTSGDLTRSCTGTDSWSGSQPVCTVITCGPVDIAGASKDPSQTSYEHNEVVTYSCNTGYQHTSGDLVRTCTGINTWSGGTPVCTAVTCSAINVDGASKSPDKPSYNYNEAVTYSCNLGYDHTSGDLVNTCSAIDTWSGAEPVCTGQSCDAEFAVEATLSPNQASYAHGEVVTYTCSSGFQHTVGNLARTCTTGAWSGSVPVCTAITCTEVSVVDATKVPDKATYTYNEAVTYSCNPGYQLTNGDSVRRCVNINTWSGSYPICTVITCAPVPIENGSRSPFKSSYAHNEVVTYRCNTGSGFTHQSGDLIRTCIGIDTWSGTAPACGGASCSNGDYTYHSTFNICIRVKTDTQQWSTARSNCQADGADLITIKTADLKDHLQDNVLTSGTKYWIGGYQTPGNNLDWHWVDGSTLSNDHLVWNTNEPNYDSEECAEVRYYSGVLLACDVPCSRTYPYICSMAAS